MTTNLDWLNLLPGFTPAQAVTTAADGQPSPTSVGPMPDPINYTTTRPADWDKVQDVGAYFTNAAGDRVYPTLANDYLKWLGFVPPTSPISSPKSIPGLTAIPDSATAIKQARQQLTALNPNYATASDQAIVSKILTDQSVFAGDTNPIRMSILAGPTSGYNTAEIAKAGTGSNFNDISWLNDLIHPAAPKAQVAAKANTPAAAYTPSAPKAAAPASPTYQDFGSEGWWTKNDEGSWQPDENANKQFGYNPDGW